MPNNCTGLIEICLIQFTSIHSEVAMYSMLLAGSHITLLSAMTETSLKFGPEWLRALSHSGGGGSGGPGLGSPPVSPGALISKYKMPEHR